MEIPDAHRLAGGIGVNPHNRRGLHFEEIPLCQLIRASGIRGDYPLAERDINGPVTFAMI